MRITHVILLLIFLFTGLFKIYAQDNLIVNPARMDSIRHLVESHKKADEEKVRLLNEYARFCFYNEEYFDGFNSTIEACDLAKQLDFKGGEIMYHYTLATFFAYGEIYFYHIQKAKILSNDENDKHISEAIMPVSYKPEATPERIKKLTPVYNHFKKIGEKEIEASILDQLSWGFYNSGDLVKTRECLEELIRIFKELNEIYPVVVYSSYLNNLANSDNDTARIESLNKEIAEAISRITQKEVLGPLNYQLANFYSYGGQSQLALKHYLNSLDYFESVHDTTMLADVYVHMHDLYAQLEMNSQALEARENQILMLEKLGDSANTKSAQGLLVWDYYHAQRYKEATMTVQKLKENSSTQAERESYSILSTGLEGQILMKLGNYKEAITPLKDRFEKSDQWSKPWGALYLAICYLGEKDYDTALRFAVSAIDYSKEIGRNDIFNRQIYQVTSEIYDALGNESMAYHYLKLYHDVVSDQNESNQVVETMLSSAVEKSQKQIDRLEEERALTEQQNKIQRLWIFSVAGALLSVLFLALILYRNNKNKQKANQLLQEQKEEIETQKKNVEETLTELKTTQNQLIQSEKMASLGELTAGIAHEIQNPLNFVNNFSEVSNELVDEMNEELNNGDLEEAKAISSDIKQNLEKINYHGKRADSIVKGMLLHSRGNTGQKELTDINALADEYLRLSYHGFRAKDKSFNADFKLETNESLPKIEVVPQEIGRVLLNLINNAFYAVNEKVKHGANSYKPLVVVQTIMNGNGVEICVKDNGSGIPETAKEKIFQPFFTTKPTGQGTGLGLSLSYDIVKAHGGELSLYSINENQTTENESGTTFRIILPTTEKTTG